jgi:hypothetical protein
VYNTVFETEGADWHFIISASLVWIFALLVTAWDFIQIQKLIYRFGIVNVVGLILGLTGFSIRRVAKRTLASIIHMKVGFCLVLKALFYEAVCFLRVYGAHASAMS